MSPRKFRPDVGIAAFHARTRLHLTVLRQVFRKPNQQLFPQFGMGDLAPPELYDRLHAIALFQEADGVILFELVVVVVRIGPELQLFDLHHVLLLLGFVLFLFLLVLIMAVVDGLGDRRNRRGRNQHQIESHLLRFPQRGGSGHDLGFTVRKNSPNLARPDGLVYVFSAILLAGRKFSAWSHELAV